MIKIGANVSKALSQLSKIENKVRNFSKASKKLGQDLTVGLSLPITGVGIASIKAAGQVESITVAFESLTGSTEKAQETVKSLLDFAANTPFQFNQIAGASKQLSAAGIATEQLNDKLTILGDIASGADVPLNEMASIYTKVKNKQKAYSEEIQQLSDRGIPIIQSLAKVMKVSESSVFDLASKGKVSFAIMEKAMINMRSEGGVFADQMKKQSRTIFGLWSTLKDNLVNASVAFGDVIVKTTDFKNIMNKMIAGIQKATEWFKALSPETKNFIVYAGLALAVLGPVIFAFGQLGFAIVGISSAITSVIGIFKTFGVVLKFVAANPIVLLLTAIAAAAYLIYSNWKPISAFFSNLWQSVTNTTSNAINYIGSILSSIGSSISSFVTMVGKGFVKLHEILIAPFVFAFDLITSGLNALIGLFTSSFEGIDDLFTNLAGLMIAPFENAFKFITEKIDGLFDVFKKAEGFVSGLFGSDDKQMALNAPVRTVAAQAQLGPRNSQSIVDVNFNNTPQGTRVYSQSKGPSLLNTNIGYQLARP